MSHQIAPDLVARIDALLPQTQCTRCGYTGCLPYAGAIAAGEAPINQCPPGGAATIESLAVLLHKPALPLNPANGFEGPMNVAWIDESRCIGCARCLAPCPVDAIVGAQKFMHTVIATRCTGCELCLPPCPVDCIEMKPHPAPQAILPSLNRERYAQHVARLEEQTEQRRRELEAKKLLATRRQSP
jgi:Na+-translocating ferredoxin:NAD+ oxidoreductase subunit B